MASRKSKKQKRKRELFAKGTKIGYAEANEDIEILEKCYVDVGDLDELKDCKKPGRIILGRTGTGKTALINILKMTEERVIEIKPESLSFEYISNSTILRTLNEMGVKFELLFILLWRHILAIELIKYCYNIEDEKSKLSFIKKLMSRTGKTKQALIDYLEKYQGSFWEKTEKRIKELTDTVTKKIEVKLSAQINEVGGDINALLKKESGTKYEITKIAQEVIDEIQVRELTLVLDWLDEELDDEQKRYFIVIDDLDQNWVDEDIRFKLIKALVKTTKDFRRVRNVKIIIALRLDLLEKVIKETPDPGFQSEKIEDLYINLRWNRKQLEELINNRINFIFREMISSGDNLTYNNILPKNMKKEKTIDFIFDRTLLRPRGVIQFLNYIIEQAFGTGKITSKNIIDAEKINSNNRLISIKDEWQLEYPQLDRFAIILKEQNYSFKLSELDEKYCEEFCYTFLTKSMAKIGKICSLADDFFENRIKYLDFLQELFFIFYHVGLVELKMETYDNFSSSIVDYHEIDKNEINLDTKVRIHKTFCRVLGINTK